MPHCTIMVGIPGSGKSTYVNKYKDACEVISLDTIREKIASEKGLIYNDLFSEEHAYLQKYVTAEYNSRIRKLADGEKDVIVDNTSVSVKARARIMKAFSSSKTQNWTFSTVYANLDFEENKKRIKARNETYPNKHISISVLYNMLANFQEPTLEEGFTKVAKIYDDF